MVAIIIRILAIALAAWLIRQVLVSIQGFGKNRSTKNSEKEAGVMVKDPICGMYMDSRLAVRLGRQDKYVYFCSEKCKSKYLSDSTNVFPHDR